jgi:hypothetical protein
LDETLYKFIQNFFGTTVKKPNLEGVAVDDEGFLDEVVGEQLAGVADVNGRLLESI